MKRLLVGFLLALSAWAQIPRISEVRVTFDDRVIHVTTGAGETSRSWTLFVDKEIMRVDGKDRKFSNPDEKGLVVEGLADLRARLEAIADGSVQTVRRVLAEQVLEFTVWDPAKGEAITWRAQGDELVLPKERAKLFTYREFAPLVRAITSLLGYAQNSVVWWLRGGGEPLKEARWTYDGGSRMYSTL